MYFKIVKNLCKQKKFITQKISGFSLIELSFVMIIMGIIMATVFKGQDLLEAARLQSCVSDLNQYRLAIMTYYSQFSQLPGNDIHAKNHFGNNAINGDGKGFIQTAEQPHVWQHLHYAGMIDSSEPPATRIGGTISAMSNPKNEMKGNFLILSKTPGTLTPLLTPQQAMILKSKAGETKANEGNILVFEGEGVNPGQCIKNGEFNLSTKTPACVIAIGF